MGTVVHARLDDETRELLEKLRRRMRLKDSEIVRMAIRTLADTELGPPASRIVGLGNFESGILDLGSNKVHLSEFGRS